MCIQACEKVVGHRFSVSRKVAVEEDCADRRKGRDVEARLQISPQKSLRLLAQETGILLGSPFTATKLIKFAHIK
jgi:hypothetical protein